MLLLLVESLLFLLDLLLEHLVLTDERRMLLWVGRAVVVRLLLLAVAAAGSLGWHQGSHRGQRGNSHRVCRLGISGVGCVVVGCVRVLVIGILILRLGRLVLVLQHGRVLTSSNYSGSSERVHLVAIIHMVVDGRSIIHIGDAIGQGLVMALLGQVGERDQVVVKGVNYWKVHLDHGRGG